MSTAVDLLRKAAASGKTGEASLEDIQAFLRSGRNAMINGGFDFWQRGTTFTTPSGYTADRWKPLYDGTIGTFTVTRQSFTLGQTDVPYEPSYFFRWNHTAAGSGSSYRLIEQRIEGVRSFASQQVSLSFYAKADTARTLTISYNQFFGGGGSPSATVAATVATFNITTAWQKYSVTFTVPSIAGKTIGTNGTDNYFSIQIQFPVNTTMTIDLSSVVLNEGAAAAPFSRHGGTFATDLAACQRYFEKSYSLDVAPGSVGTTVGVAIFQIGSYAVPNNSDYGNVWFVVAKSRANFSGTFTCYDYQGNPNVVNDGSIAEKGANSGVAGDSGVTGCVIRNNSGSPVSSPDGRILFNWAAEAEI